MQNAPGAKELCFYGDELAALEIITDEIVAAAENDPCVEHIKTRIKSVDSVKKKLERKNLPFTKESAFSNLYDLAGVRLICRYADEIEHIYSLFENDERFKTVCTKDYVRRPKPNGYRSFHLVVERQVLLGSKKKGVFAEIQIRTISMDCWASLEHRLKYKKNISDEAMIVSELKKCADEMYSSEISLMTLRDLINCAD